MRQQEQQKLAEEQLRTSSLMSEKQDLEDRLAALTKKISGIIYIGFILAIIHEGYKSIIATCSLVHSLEYHPFPLCTKVQNLSSSMLLFHLEKEKERGGISLDVFENL